MDFDLQSLIGIRFAFPQAFLLLLLVPLLFWMRGRGRGRRGRPTIRFSWVRPAVQAGRSWRQKLSAVPTVLRVMALVLLVVALARPLDSRDAERVRDVNEGIAIEMVVDRSSSMAAEMVMGDRRMNRLEVVKMVFQQFVLGNGEELQGRPNDLVGMISFARFAETTCPLTLAHGALPRFLETVQLARPRTAEDGTALGDAIALAAARLEKAEEAVARQAPERADRYEIKSKVMILLTDGRQTAGKRDPLEAARLARDWGIKIYTIAVGGEDSATGRDSLFGAMLQARRGQEADTRTLQAVADETGGKFFLAQSVGALTGIYEEIDQLERSEIQSLEFIDFTEAFSWFAIPALLLLALEVTLNCTLFRRIP